MMYIRFQGVLWGPPAPRSMSTSCGQSEVKVTVVYKQIGTGSGPNEG